MSVEDTRTIRLRAADSRAFAEALRSPGSQTPGSRRPHGGTLADWRLSGRRPRVVRLRRRMPSRSSSRCTWALTADLARCMWHRQSHRSETPSKACCRYHVEPSARKARRRGVGPGRRRARRFAPGCPKTRSIPTRPLCCAGLSERVWKTTRATRSRRTQLSLHRPAALGRRMAPRQ